MGTYTFRLASALGQAGCQVSVLAGPSDQPDRPQANVTVHRLSAHYEPPLPVGQRSIPLLASPFAADEHGASAGLALAAWDLGSGSGLRDIEDLTPLDVIEAPEHAANGLSAGRARRWPLVVCHARALGPLF